MHAATRTGGSAPSAAAPFSRHGVAFGCRAARSPGRGLAAASHPCNAVVCTTSQCCSRGGACGFRAVHDRNLYSWHGAGRPPSSDALQCLLVRRRSSHSVSHHPPLFSAIVAKCQFTYVFVDLLIVWLSVRPHGVVTIPPQFSCSRKNFLHGRRAVLGVYILWFSMLILQHMDLAPGKPSIYPYFGSWEAGEKMGQVLCWWESFVAGWEKVG